MDEKTIIQTLNEAYFSDRPDEKEMLGFIPKLLRGGHSFLDVGASLGQFTKAASKVLRHGTIIAVEADPLRYNELEKNCQSWAAATGNSIRAVHGAASNRQGTVEFCVTNSGVSGGLSQHDLDHIPSESRSRVAWTKVSVPAVTLDDVVADMTPNLVKMDIEAAEILALEGAPRLLRSMHTTWIMELHTFTDPLGRRPTEVVPPMMEKLGYRTIVIRDKHVFSRDPWRTAPWAYLKTSPRLLARRVKRTLTGRRVN